MSIQKFNYNELLVRAFNDTENNIWFVGRDVAKVLEYKNTKKAIIDNVDEEDKKRASDYKGNWKLPLVKLHPQSLLINESGLYFLILRSFSV